MSKRNFYDPDQAVFCPTSASIANTLKLADGTWVTDFAKLGLETSGSAKLYPDMRLNWLSNQFGSFDGKSVLELGSLEGAHTLYFEKMGCAKVVGVEANEAHFMKSLIVKNAMNTSNVQFLLGDFEKHLTACTEEYDLISACGVLYHMTNPGEIIRQAARISNDAIFIWTVLYDEEFTTSTHKSLISGQQTVDIDGFKYEGYRHHYRSINPKKAKKDKNFSGGLEDYALWLSEDELLRVLQHYGFSKITSKTVTDNPRHGKNILLLARK